MNDTHTSNNWYPPACDTDFAFQLPITPSDYTSTFQVTMPASQPNSELGRLAHRRRASCAISIIQESPAGHVPCPPQPCPSRSLSDSMLVVKPGRECITSFDNEANTNTRQWPMEIRTWWKPSHANEKPPYSYATLIAHAILCSAHGKLTLSDIYRWISDQYPYYALGSHGWQNSIRHNLSLNKRSFVKLERRPSKQNPGKGSYWAIIPGAERPFIENLTRKGGPRRHHQSTLPLGAQFAVADTPQGLARHDSAIDVEGEGCKITKLCSANLLITVPEDYQENKNTARSGASDYLHISNEDEEIASIQYSPDQFTQTTRSTSPLYTTFRMSKVEKDKPTQSISRRTRRSKKRKQRTREDSYDSDCDSGVDVSNEYIGSLHKRKQRRKLAKEQAELQKAEQLSHENQAVTNEGESNLELSWRNMLASGLELLCPEQAGFDLYSEFSYLANAEGEAADYFSHCPTHAITRPLDIDLSLQHPLQKEALDKQDQSNVAFASKNFSSMLGNLPVDMQKSKQMTPELSGVTFAQLLQSATVDDETSKYLKFESSDDEETSNSTDSYCVTPPSLPLDDLYPQLH